MPQPCRPGARLALRYRLPRDGDDGQPPEDPHHLDDGEPRRSEAELCAEPSPGQFLPLSHPPVDQSGPLDVEIISEGLIVMLRQLSYAIKNQLKAPKAPY